MIIITYKILKVSNWINEHLGRPVAHGYANFAALPQIFAHA